MCLLITKSSQATEADRLLFVPICSNSNIREMPRHNTSNTKKILVQTVQTAVLTAAMCVLNINHVLYSKVVHSIFSTYYTTIKNKRQTLVFLLFAYHQMTLFVTPARRIPPVERHRLNISHKSFHSTLTTVRWGFHDSLFDCLTFEDGADSLPRNVGE